MTTRRETHRAGEHGQIVVFVAVSLVALLGMGALSIDAAYMYDQRNKLYAAADAAAKSAAFAYKQNTTSVLWEFGKHEVELLGLTPVTVCGSTSGTALCVNHPPTFDPASPYYLNPNFVEAVVSRPSTASFFGKVLGWMSASPGARAVAGTVSPADCVIINQDLSIGGFTFTLDGCGVAIGGNLAGTNPNAEVEDPGGAHTPPVNVVGTCSGYCSDMGDLNTGAAAPTDPLAGKLAAVTWPDATLFPGNTTCVAGTTPVLAANKCYNNISPAVTTLLPGNYYITGAVNIDNLSGDNVFLYVTNECTDPSCGPGGLLNVVGNNKRLHLTAQTTGPYTGIALWQHVNDTNPFSCLGCGPAGTNESWPPNAFRLEWSGALYMPGVDQQYKNGVDFVPLNGCALYITRNLTVKNGNGSFTNRNCAALYGGAAFLSIAVTE